MNSKSRRRFHSRSSKLHIGSNEPTSRSRWLSVHPHDPDLPWGSIAVDNLKRCSNGYPRCGFWIEILERYIESSVSIAPRTHLRYMSDRNIFSTIIHWHIDISIRWHNASSVLNKLCLSLPSCLHITVRISLPKTDALLHKFWCTCKDDIHDEETVSSSKGFIYYISTSVVWAAFASCHSNVP